MIVLQYGINRYSHIRLFPWSVNIDLFLFLLLDLFIVQEILSILSIIPFPAYSCCYRSKLILQIQYLGWDIIVSHAFSTSVASPTFLAWQWSADIPNRLNLHIETQLVSVRFRHPTRRRRVWILTGSQWLVAYYPPKLRKPWNSKYFKRQSCLTTVSLWSSYEWLSEIRWFLQSTFS